MLYYVITQTNHYISEVVMSNLVFPDSLLEIWDWWHIPSNQQEGDPSKNGWMLLRKLENRMKYKCFNPIFKDDAVHYALYDIFSYSSREDLERFKNENFLACEIRRNIAMDQNPEGYDMDRKLRGAIRSLIAENKVHSLDLELKKIAKDSKFKSVSAPNKMGSYSNYERKKSEIPFYKKPPRKKVIKDVLPVIDIINDTDGTDTKKKKRKGVSLITQSNAKELVEKLLNAFGGWAEFQDIEKAAWNHVPHSTLIRGVNDIDSQSSSGQFDEEEGPFQPGWDQSSLSAIFIRTIQNRCEEIWIEICRINKERFFCLYIFPEFLDLPPEGNLEDYGNDSTMSGYKKDINKMLKKQTMLLFDEFELEYSHKSQKKEKKEKEQKRDRIYFFFGKEKELKQQTMKEYCHFLNHRCKEKGYDPHISQKEYNKQHNKQLTQEGIVS